ncbi:MAG TPA: 50S ribosomal protein L11 methyltransferase [Dehalococcoidia bacterium]|nr:50S ribosomal protein L11 methyltransferase [Dehalococcoidia bacterium]
MQWHELSIEVPFEYVEPISYLFDRYGHGMSMEILGSDQVLLRTYLPSTSRQRLAHIEVGVKLTSLLQPLGELKIEPLPPDEDWQNAWKSHFNLLKLGRHLVIKPSWIEYQPEPEDLVIELDPGMAFGTGYHPTTYTCLEALENLIEPGMNVLDLGVGSGILTIAAAKLGARNVLAMDIDSVAIKTARQNFRRLGILQRVTLVQGTLPNPLARPGEFDLVVANISSRAIRERAAHMLPLLNQPGALIASGIINDQAQETEEALARAGFVVQNTWPKDDWISLVCRASNISA